MTGIEFVMIFTVAAFNLAVVARSIGLYKLVVYTEFGSGSLKQCRLSVNPRINLVVNSGPLSV